jgi:PST family polysaccharide transporter
MPAVEPTNDSKGAGALSRSTLAGFIWMMIQSLGGRLSGFLGQLVLAWFLVPADFGVVALAYSVVAIAAAAAYSGVDQVLMQRMQTMHRWTAPASWVALGLALAGFLAVMIAAPIAAHIYKTPQLIPLIAIAAIALPVQSLSMASHVALRAQLNFRFEASYNLFESVLTQVLTAFLAWRGFGPYSFVLPAPAMAFLRLAVFQIRAPVRRTGRMRKVQIGYLISRGSSVLTSRLITSLVDQGDYMVLGLFATHAVVGLYYFAFKLAAQPMRMLAANFTLVLVPAFAQLRSEPDRQRAAAYSASRVLSHVVVPICFLQAALADPALGLLFGAKWRGSILFVQILSLGLPVEAITWIARDLMGARGQFRRVLVYSCIFSPWFFVLVATGAYFGAGLGVAIGVSLFYFFAGPIYSTTVFGTPGKRAAEMIDLYVAPYLIALMAIGGVYAASFVPVFHHAALLRLIWIGAVGPLAYAGLMAAFRRTLLMEILNRFGLQRRLAALGILRSA